MTLEDELDLDGLISQTDDNPNNRIISHLFDAKEFEKDGIDLRTQLNTRQIADITKLHFLADALDMKTLKSFVVKFMRLKVSQDREGRKELIKAVENTLESSKTNEFMSKWGSVIGGK